MTITIQSEGRRHYLIGDTYSIRAALREAGCKWDADRKAWWTGKREVAEACIARASEAAAATEAALPPASGELVAVEGNTYPVRDQLRAMGGSWDGARKVWMVPASRLEAAKGLVKAAPREAYRPTKCKQCGVPAWDGRRGSGGVKLRRDGVCWDCYEVGCEDMGDYSHRYGRG